MVFAQDTLVQTNGARLAVQLLQEQAETIQYRRFDYPDGPLFTISRTEVAELIYRDGSRKVMTRPVDSQKTSDPGPGVVNVPEYTHAGGEEEQEEAGRQVSFQFAAVLNGSYGNKPRRDAEEAVGHGSSASSYSRPGKEYYKTGFSAGIQVLLGRSAYVKGLAGIQYTFSQADFNYNSSYIDRSKSSPYETYSVRTELNYKNNSHFIGLIGGIHVRVFKGFYIESALALHGCVASHNRIHGVITYHNGASPTTYHEVSDSISGFRPVGVALAIVPKVGYGFKAGQQKFGVYAACNLAFKYNLPWYLFGLSWYPFSRLR